MSRKSKAKAVKHQNEIRDFFRYVFVPPFKDDDIVCRTMGNSGTDIIFSPVLHESIPFNIECKRHEDKTWNSTYRKSFEQAFMYENGLLIRRANRCKNHFFMRTNDIIKINPFILRTGDILTHESFKTFATTKSQKTQLYNEYVHFGEMKFLETLFTIRRNYV